MGIAYEVADIREYRSKKKYDAVISLFHVMSYQTSNDDIKQDFSSARAALNPGGLLVFDAWYGSEVLIDLPAVRIKKVEDDANRLIRLCRPEIWDTTNTVDVHYEILVVNKNDSTTKAINETHHMRFFFCPEVKEYLNQAGFKLLEVLDCKTLEKTSFGSWTCYFIAVAE